MDVTKKRTKNKGHFATEKRNNTIFLFLILALPILQFIIFYIVVNFNSILLAFQEFDGKDFVFTAGGKNFKNFITDVFTDETMGVRVVNTCIQFGLSFLIGFPLSILISYGIWRGIPGAGAFEVILYLPKIISHIVFVILFRVIIEDLLPSLFPDSNIITLLQGDSSFITVVLFALWLSLSGNMVLYLGAMSSINTSVVEYGRLDGLTPIGEFFHVVIPAIWPTIVVFTLTQIGAFFTNYGEFFNMYGGKLQDQYQTLGYYFFVTVIGNASEVNYPYASAAGLCFTAVACGVTLGIKYLMEHFGPSEE